MKVTGYRIALPALMIAAAAGCVALKPVVGPEGIPVAGLGRLASVEEFRFAYETRPSCKLENGGGGDKPREWKAVQTNQMTSDTYRVVGRFVHKTGRTADYVAFRVADSSGKQFWLRNAPTKDAEQAVRSWRCVVGVDWIDKHPPKLQAPVVHLATASNRCQRIIPIVGGAGDVTFSPYTVTGYGVFAGAPPTRAEAAEGGQGVLAVGVRLEAEGGEKVLTVPVESFDACFAAADKSPPPPAEAKALLAWLAESDPDSVDPPPASRETVEAVTGADLSRCQQEGQGATEHLECRYPMVRMTTAKGAGPFGPSVLDLTRDRMVDSYHLYGGRMIPAAEVLSVVAAVRISKLDENARFAQVFRKALTDNVNDPARVRQRGRLGFRVLALQRGAEASNATHLINLEVEFKVPPLETLEEIRRHEYVAGKRRKHNPAYDKAREEVRLAEELIEDKTNQLTLAEQATKAVEEGCSSTSSQLPWYARAAISTGCGAASATAVAAAQSALSDAKGALSEAQRRVESTPTDIDVDEVKTVDYLVKILRRSGEARAAMTIVSAASPKQALYEAQVTVPFDASSEEIKDDPEHGLSGKTANPPTEADVQTALAKALIPQVDALMVKWGAQRRVGGDIGDLKPGTRSWMVAVARRAASDRPVKLLSDILENRTENLGADDLQYTIRLPKDAASRCFTFGAVAMGGGSDVILEVGHDDATGFEVSGRDARLDPDAAFELCGLQPGLYKARLQFRDRKRLPGGVLVSLFDSTPGAAEDRDTLAATAGLPTVPRKGETLELNGEGKTHYVGAGNTVIEGRTGDRDGDGIPDDVDRCPYDRESVNRHLDDDGCPDTAPAGARKR